MKFQDIQSGDFNKTLMKKINLNENFIVVFTIKKANFIKLQKFVEKPLKEVGHPCKGYTTVEVCTNIIGAAKIKSVLKNIINDGI